MTIPVPDDLVQVCHAILRENKTDDEWSEIESDDMFQQGSIHGGYEALEQAFCFSYYAPDGDEFWFQLTLPEIKDVASGQKQLVEIRPAR